MLQQTLPGDHTCARPKARRQTASLEAPRCIVRLLHRWTPHCTGSGRHSGCQSPKHDSAALPDALAQRPSGVCSVGIYAVVQWCIMKLPIARCRQAEMDCCRLSQQISGIMRGVREGVSTSFQQWQSVFRQAAHSVTFASSSAIFRAIDSILRAPARCSVLGIKKAHCRGRSHAAVSATVHQLLETAPL